MHVFGIRPDTGRQSTTLIVTAYQQHFIDQSIGPTGPTCRSLPPSIAVEDGDEEEKDEEWIQQKNK